MRKQSYYWDPNETRSYNAIFNFVIGSRGCGKTYGALKYVIKKWLATRGTDNPWQFIYTRRFATELEGLTSGVRGSVGTVFDAVRREFPGHKLEAKNNVLLCDDEAMGYAIPLNKGGTLKSNPMPFVHTIIFEEFLITDSAHHYYRDEAKLMLDFHITVDRYENRVTWFFLANNAGINNPYFTYFNLDYPKKRRKLFGNDKQILVELCENPEFIDNVKQTRLGKLIAETKFGEYAIENKAIDNNNDFIMKKTGTCDYQFMFLYFDKKIGIWFDYKNCCYFISNDVIENGTRCYAATTFDQKPNVMLFKGNRGILINRLIEGYKNGIVFYESAALKSWFRDIMKLVYL